MKKFMISIFILASITSVGCKDTIVLEENASINQTVEKYEFTEEAIDLNGDFMFMNYENNKVIGARYNIEETKYVPSDEINENYEYFSISDKSNEINKIYDDIALNSEGLTMNYKWDYYGITNEVEKDLELDKREYYYVDKLKDISIRLDGARDILYKLRDEMIYFDYGNKLPGNDDYYIMYLCSGWDGAEKHLYRDQQIIIVDIKNEKIFYKEELEDKENFIYLTYFDKNLNSIMAITFDGKVKKVNLNGNYIEFEEYKTLNLQEYTLNNNNIDYRRYREVLDNKVVISLINSNSVNKYFTGIYDMVSGELKILDKEIQINYVLGKNNLVFAIYDEEAYLGKVKEDSSVELLYSLSTKEEKCLEAYGIINEEGDKIFVNKYMARAFSEEYPNYIDRHNIEYKYSFINIDRK